MPITVLITLWGLAVSWVLAYWVGIAVLLYNVL